MIGIDLDRLHFSSTHWNLRSGPGTGMGSGPLTIAFFVRRTDRRIPGGKWAPAVHSGLPLKANHLKGIFL
ncbi:MAG: hypothetical protein C4530_17720 [Desulfobacteraceae bacterium]|nr:MAG: hypothetical protein C4530_17720 [Desulfobacteraceae bacterium]